MKSRVGVLLGLVMVASGCTVAEGPSVGDPTAPQLGGAETGTDAELAAAEAAFDEATIEQAAIETVAIVTMPNGNQLEFVAVLDDAQVGVTERGSSPSLLTEEDRQASVLDLFLAVAGPEAAVPDVFAKVSPDAPGLVGRTLVARLPEPIQAHSAFMETHREAAPVDKAVGYCTRSAEGAVYFVNHSCKTQNLLNSFCDPMYNYIDESNWIELIRQSAEKKKKSYSRTAACVSAGDVRHYYWNGLNWKLLMTEEIAANSQEWKLWDANVAWYRRIIHRTYHPQNGGFIRAWSEFHN